jgi:hypothetical protein
MNDEVVEMVTMQCHVIMKKNCFGKKIMFVKLHNFNLVLLWIGRTEGDVIKDENNEYF